MVSWKCIRFHGSLLVIIIIIIIIIVVVVVVVIIIIIIIIIIEYIKNKRKRNCIMYCIIEV